MASMLDRGFAPCLLPGAAVPGADTALKWENPKRRRGWPGWGVSLQLWFGAGFRLPTSSCAVAVVGIGRASQSCTCTPCALQRSENAT